MGLQLAGSIKTLITVFASKGFFASMAPLMDLECARLGEGASAFVTFEGSGPSMHHQVRLQVLVL